MKLLTTAIVSVLMLGTSSLAFARDNLSIAGSSTVLPFATIVAEQFGQLGQFPTPIVESGGTGGGLKLFCESVDEASIDIANASRAMKQEELETCNANGITDIREIKFGYDGIVFASSVATAHFELTEQELYKALAAKVMVDGQLVDNPYTNWKQINANLPDQPILAYIPGENHGTREVFEEKVLIAGCHEVNADIAKDDCIAVRKDGLAVDIAGDYTETLARIETTNTAIGVFGLSFYESNVDKIQVATIDGVVPSAGTIADGTYPVSRPLFFYVKGEHIGVVPGLDEYVQFFLNDSIAGPNGRLVDAGLVPMPDAERAAVLDAYNNGVVYVAK